MRRMRADVELLEGISVVTDCFVAAAAKHLMFEEFRQLLDDVKHGLESYTMFQCVAACSSIECAIEKSAFPDRPRPRWKTLTNITKQPAVLG